MIRPSTMPAFLIDAIKFDPAALILPSRDRRKALRFVVPIPAFAGEELCYPLHYPADMRQRDGSSHPLAGSLHPKAGRPLEDWRGRPVLSSDGSVPRGVVFFNYEDAVFQGVRSSGDGIVIFDRPSDTQARALQDFVMAGGGPAALSSVGRVLALLRQAQQIGLDDRYNSDLAYAHRSLTPVADLATGIPAFGLHLRVGDKVRAVFVPGPARVGDLLLGAEGGVFLSIAVHPDSGEREVRTVSPEAFVDTYTAADGSQLDLADLPQERPWLQ